jgi:myo-inositol-1(or 4)-monophosphatase
MRDWQRAAVVDLLVECTRIALEHYERPRRELKDDLSLVTDADRAVEQRMARSLDRPEDGSWMIGEETIARRGEDYIGAAFGGTAWVVDPIDGTAPYAHHVPTWGISIGFMRRGVLEEGAIILPATGELYVSDGPEVYTGTSSEERGWDYADLSPMRVSPRPIDDGGMICLDQKSVRGMLIRKPNPLQALCCAVMPMAYLCLGRYAAYVGRVKLWDAAGGLPLLLKCGLVARTLGGDPLDGRVDEEHWHLAADDPGRWLMKEPAVFAADDESARRAAALLESVKPRTG